VEENLKFILFSHIWASCNFLLITLRLWIWIWSHPN